MEDVNRFIYIYINKFIDRTLEEANNRIEVIRLLSWVCERVVDKCLFYNGGNTSIIFSKFSFDRLNISSILETNKTETWKSNGFSFWITLMQLATSSLILVFLNGGERRLFSVSSATNLSFTAGNCRVSISGISYR